MPYEADAVEHLIADQTDAVLDFGAGHADIATDRCWTGSPPRWRSTSSSF